MCTTFHPRSGSLQVETILTVALVMLTLCGMVRDSIPHAQMPSSARSQALTPSARLRATYNTAGMYNMQRTSLHGRVQ